ncbi:MAG: UDP-2,3-diacylglucosamine diphosphatase [Bacteroidetes bacterium]|nr:MAG: UDP-2,3-diacylglucosamine diphosphatase [Bacteroidota bacterium]
MAKRKLEIAVISDVHLGTYGCHAKELNQYLKSIQPDILVLNGDIIDIWQFSKRYWPDSHMKIVQRITKMITQGTQVYYLTGNHDEMLRRFSDFHLNNFQLLNKLILEHDGKKMWFFHGDVFDITMKHSKWLAKLGGAGYDLLILLNRFVNFISQRVLRRGKISLSKKIKDSVKHAIKFINDFEQTAIDLALEEGYDMVLCGHIHQPCDRTIESDGKTVRYLNSGDWIENLSALEYYDGDWHLIKYADTVIDAQEEEEEFQALPAMQFLYEDIIRHSGNGQWAYQPGA